MSGRQGEKVDARLANIGGWTPNLSSSLVVLYEGDCPRAFLEHHLWVATPRKSLMLEHIVCIGVE